MHLIGLVGHFNRHFNPAFFNKRIMCMSGWPMKLVFVDEQASKTKHEDHHRASVAISEIERRYLKPPNQGFFQGANPEEFNLENVCECTPDPLVNNPYSLLYFLCFRCLC